MAALLIIGDKNHPLIWSVFHLNKVFNPLWIDFINAGRPATGVVYTLSRDICRHLSWHSLEDRPGRRERGRRNHNGQRRNELNWDKDTKLFDSSTTRPKVKIPVLLLHQWMQEQRTSWCDGLWQGQQDNTSENVWVKGLTVWNQPQAFSCKAIVFRLPSPACVRVWFSSILSFLQTQIPIHWEHCDTAGFIKYS